MDVSVIIVNYNKVCSVDLFIDEFPRVRVKPLKENIGFGKANNIGVKHAKGRFVFFLNSDTFLLFDFFFFLVNYLDTHESVVLCGGQLFDRERKPTGSYIEYPDLRFFLSLVL